MKTTKTTKTEMVLRVARNKGVGNVTRIKNRLEVTETRLMAMLNGLQRKGLIRYNRIGAKLFIYNA
jgi:Mn-dependent DtxR family transcriptional regulator